MSFVVTLDNGNKYRLQKEALVKIGDPATSNPSKQVMDEAIKVPAGLTLRKLFTNAVNKVGSGKIWVYKYITANCQDFVIDLLSNSIQLTETQTNWIKQDVSALKNMDPTIQAIINKTIKTAADVQKFEQNLVDDWSKFSSAASSAAKSKIQGTLKSAGGVVGDVVSSIPKPKVKVPKFKF